VETYCWLTVRSPPRPVCAGCGRWPGWPAALVQWRECIRGGRSPDHRPDSRPYGVRDDALYKSTFFTFLVFYLLQTDRQTTCNLNTALCTSASRCNQPFSYLITVAHHFFFSNWRNCMFYAIIDKSHFNHAGGKAWTIQIQPKIFLFHLYASKNGKWGREHRFDKLFF